MRCRDPRVTRTLCAVASALVLVMAQACKRGTEAGTKSRECLSFDASSEIPELAKKVGTAASPDAGAGPRTEERAWVASSDSEAVSRLCDPALLGVFEQADRALDSSETRDAAKATGTAATGEAGLRLAALPTGARRLVPESVENAARFLARFEGWLQASRFGMGRSEKARSALAREIADIERHGQRMLRGGRSPRDVRNFLRSRLARLRLSQQDDFIPVDSAMASLPGSPRPIPVPGANWVTAQPPGRASPFEFDSPAQRELASTTPLVESPPSPRFERNPRYLAFLSDLESHRARGRAAWEDYLNDDIGKGYWIRHSEPDFVKLPRGLDPAFERGFEDMRRFMNAPDELFDAMQELEGDVMKLVRARQASGKPVTPEAALEEILSAMERKNGFGKPVNVDRVLTREEFLGVLASGAPIIDSKFEKHLHGSLTHRVQWNVIMRRMARRKSEYGALAAVDYYKELGNVTSAGRLDFTGTGYEVGHGQTLWVPLFDASGAHLNKPELFHDAFKTVLPGLGKW